MFLISWTDKAITTPGETLPFWVIATEVAFMVIGISTVSHLIWTRHCHTWHKFVSRMMQNGVLRDQSWMSSLPYASVSASPAPLSSIYQLLVQYKLIHVILCHCIWLFTTLAFGICGFEYVISIYVNLRVRLLSACRFLFILVHF